MNPKILCVDDDQNVLSAYQRSLRKQFDIETALGGNAGLLAVQERGPYAVIIADMQMPGMDGIEFLEIVHDQAPESIRIMLTGNADQTTAVEAINRGQVFQFLTKPCPPDVLALAIEAGVKQYQLVTAERELLENTLNGSIRVLTDILSLVERDAFGRSQKLRDAVRAFAESLNIRKTWDLEAAAMLLHIGCVTIPPALIDRVRSGQPLMEQEAQLWTRVPDIGRGLINKIPRLESVADIVYYQDKHFDGSGFPVNLKAGEAIPIGARIIKVLKDMLELEEHGCPRERALEEMRLRAGWYDPRVLESVSRHFDVYVEGPAAASYERIATSLGALKVDQMLASDVVTQDGLLIARSGTLVSPLLLERLLNFRQVSGIREPIYVVVHPEKEKAAA
ncbi:MAG: response regulator [Verrucomicrobia bacterium]|nr:response regulator [Verrucomicrobiota bacterium]